MLVPGSTLDGHIFDDKMFHGCSHPWLAPRIEREKLDAYVKEDPYVVNGLVRFLKARVLSFFDGETKVISFGVDRGMFLGRDTTRRHAKSTVDMPKGSFPSTCQNDSSTCQIMRVPVNMPKRRFCVRRHAKRTRRHAKKTARNANFFILREVFYIAGRFFWHVDASHPNLLAQYSKLQVLACRVSSNTCLVVIFAVDQ